ncbi:unnamed protein product [Soboliphyme baturini]|uniref:RF_PROK_I domain-containing protein n=1 Tax=Soboliphyme baturini TaxID=241478 RepID=A0A183IKH6_9BILA|nr:unnamed protein product [Soboliphyme baturini]
MQHWKSSFSTGCCLKVFRVSAADFNGGGHRFTSSSDFSVFVCYTLTSALYEHKISKSGHLTITSERTRSQHLNLADCLDKLRFSIRECEKETRPKGLSEEDMKIIKAKAAADRRRIETKRWRSALKQPLS